MVRWLLELYRRSADSEWVHSNEIARTINYRSGGEFSILKWWGFITSSSTGDKRESNGLWKITPAGVLFVENKSTAAEIVRLYNDTFLGFEGEQVGVIEALGKYDYQSLVGATT